MHDVLVIGGGHAGAEAAWAAGRLGARTALLTFQRDAIGRMSCNPAIGGIGKGQMVREIDALGGLMGRVADATGIQFRMLNRRKGPAMWAPRCQSDQQRYAEAVQNHLAVCPNLDIIEAGVEEILVEDGRVTGVRLHSGEILGARTVIVTSGTFLGALMHTGEAKTAGGRVGEKAATGLSANLASLGLRLERLKTGTPPRLDRDTIDFSQTSEQLGDEEPVPFSFLTDRIEAEQVCCWITFTNDEIHEQIRNNLHRAPMYSGQIDSTGPRYCPSIEDKVVRFADKDRHQIFLEPEGRDSQRIYCNGISTSLPQDVQEEIVRRIPGLQEAKILQLGYAVEYDYVPPEQIHANLMTKPVAGLFLAGQINGTSGYEEAAGQGLLAGVNAVRWIGAQEPLILGRDEAYVGVMVDDLVTRGLIEPYRMFTSRAEHRLHLRYDNADLRLTPLGREMGLVDDERWQRFSARRESLETLRGLFDRCRVEGRPVGDWLKRQEEDGQRFVAAFPELQPYWQQRDVWGSALVDVRYAGYIERQQKAIEEFQVLEQRRIPSDWQYESISHLRREALERWNTVRPVSVGQAARVSGIRPTDVSMLLVALQRDEGARDAGS